MIKAVIFDLDGTLVDSKPVNFLTFNRTLEAFGLSRIDEKTHSLAFCMPARASLAHFGIREEDLDGALDFWMGLLQEHASMSQLFPGIEALIGVLRERGYGLGVITSRRKKSVLRDLKRFGLIDLFDPIVSVDDVKAPKPHRDSLDVYLERAQLKEEEVIYLGDSHSDSDFALEGGIPFALALWGTLDPDLKATVKLKEPADLLVYLEDQEEMGSF
ncbi:MAG: HAD family hydrolase [Tissierellia bacterium]|nr:HAD family hydrolase [Tissierellia bacterium]